MNTVSGRRVPPGIVPDNVVRRIASLAKAANRGSPEDLAEFRVDKPRHRPAPLLAVNGVYTNRS